MGLVAKQAVAPLAVDFGDDVRRQVRQLGFCAGRPCEQEVNLVPRQPLVGRDVEGVADGPGVAEQPDEGPREILMVGECPQGGTVAVHDHGLALAHTMNDGIAAVHWEQRAVVGMRRAHHGEWKFLSAVGGQQCFFAGYFVARVFPHRIVERCGFADRQAAWRRLIGRCRANEHELPRAATEKLNVQGDLLGREGDEVDHHVELEIANRRARRSRIAHVTRQHLDAERNLPSGLAPAQVEKLDARLDGDPRASRDRRLRTSRAPLPRHRQRAGAAADGETA